MTTPIENLEPTLDLTVRDQDTPPWATRVISRLISLGYKQLLASFSGGGDSGAIEYWLFLQDRVFLNSNDLHLDMHSNQGFVKTKISEDRFTLGHDVDLANTLIGKTTNLNNNYSIPEEYLVGTGLEKNDITLFEDFIYGTLINVDFNGDTYSHGCLLFDLLTGNILNKTSMEVKVQELQEDQIIKIRNNFSVLSDSSLLDEL